MAKVFGADAGIEQGAYPVEAGHADQPGITQAGQAGDDADDPLGWFAAQLDQRIDADVAGGAHAIGQAEEDQPGEQCLGQGIAPGHGLGQVENEVTDGEQRCIAAEEVAQAVEQGVEVVEDHVDECHKRHGCQEKGDKAFLQSIPEVVEALHGKLRKKPTTTTSGRPWSRKFSWPGWLPGPLRSARCRSRTRTSSRPDARRCAKRHAVLRSR
ncbi:hypothetical protein FQZ97_1015630 [compost metagenome]